MHVLLFDMHTGGHHLEYASLLRQELTELWSDIEITILSTVREGHHEEFLDPETVKYLYDDDVLDRLHPKSATGHAIRAIRNPRGSIVADALEYVEERSYDLVHFLHADDILKEIYRHGQSIETPIVATINGSYFRVQTRRRTAIAKRLIEHGLTDIASTAVPDVFSRRGPWNHVNLHRLARDNVVKEFFVASEIGRELILSATDIEQYAPLTKIPDPVETWSNEAFDRQSARDRLDLTEEEYVFTFFGEMRAEKGVDLLVDALEEYDGSPITVILAGKPVAVDARKIERGVANPDVTVVPELGFVPQEAVPDYFFAADAVILPYRRSFGTYRTSGVFQKACSAGRPVIAPNFGAFAARVSKWNLGTTFEPGSAESLSAVLASVASNPEGILDEQSMSEYVESQTYGRLAERSSKTYRRVLGADAGVAHEQKA
ncbi:glycosyltransferase [Halorhabdus rudnickae]|uniref:glycosyltransferase n=1 Tax=Halorhabdus rudnickae TaxID=1775544 RepID=UPI0010835961|nr:glycosyltransferase [Halorhabdus rudnickae]